MMRVKLCLANQRYLREALRSATAPFSLMRLIQGFYEQLLLYAVRQAETAARARRRLVVASRSSSF